MDESALDSEFEAWNEAGDEDEFDPAWDDDDFDVADESADDEADEPSDDEADEPADDEADEPADDAADEFSGEAEEPADDGADELAGEAEEADEAFEESEESEEELDESSNDEAFDESEADAETEAVDVSAELPDKAPGAEAQERETPSDKAPAKEDEARSRPDQGFGPRISDKLGSTLALRRGRIRAYSHPWIFRGDVDEVGVAEGPVRIIDGFGRFVGRGFMNARTSLCCRVVSRVDAPLDERFFASRIAQARVRRSSIDREAYRLLFSEGDGVPGLVVDRYGPVLVLQCLTLGMAKSRGTLVAALRSELGELAVYSADDPHSAELEGFPAERGWFDKEGPATVVVDELGVKSTVTFGMGHKTGMYLDQAEHRVRIGKLAEGRRVLDAFSYAGGFAIHAAKRGAQSVVSVDSSPDAITLQTSNITINGVADSVQLVATNAFDELRRREKLRERFGLVILDPPPFAPSRRSLESAARGYKEVNLRAMRLLDRGGLLATFTCSHHASDAFLEDILREAAGDARLSFRVRERLDQPADHPVELQVPESRYLRGVLLEVEG
ncbi:MAG: class I SAM-dependent rRNA methyltransferase [Deltaproteobacteria bacterium]|nr:class I SAM-dependent rRNA methyltransferase [Deltaproteobacteria bacterium]